MGKSKWINKKQANRKVRPAAENPKITKYRDLAKLNKNSNKPTSMKLTEDNLAIHDAVMNDAELSIPSTNQLEQDPIENSISNLSIGETELNRLKGFTNGDQISDAQTFATCFTNCTNASFGYFLQKFNSNSSVHKEMLSILAAATDIINDQNEEDNNDKYFELLTNSIYQIQSTLELTANIILLYYVIKRMNSDSLKSNFSSYQQLTSDLLKKYLNSSNVSFVKFLLKTYFIFLKEQDQLEWDNSITRTCFVDNLLVLTVHPKSRIRKVAKESVVELFKKIDQEQTEVKTTIKSIDNDNLNNQQHPIYEITTQFAIRKIKETNGDDITEALYILNLWKEIINFLPHDHLKSACEQIIGLLSLGNVLIFTNCMQILENLFKLESRHLNSSLNYNIISHLFDSQPSFSDHQPLLAWCSVTKYAELNLFNLNKKQFIDHLIKLFGVYFNCLQCDNQVIRSFAGQCICDLLDKAISCQDEFNQSVFIAIGESLRDFLSFKHASIWRLIFKIYSYYFKLNGEKYVDIINKSFVKLLNLKNLDCEESKLLKYDHPIRSLIKYHGVEFVLDKIKFEPDFNNYTINNVWLIDILRFNIKNDKIENFINFILSQAKKICPNLDQNFNIDNKNPWLFSYVQLWSLLPVFLNEPTDIKEQFKSEFAKMLGDGINNAPPIRPFILKSLRQLISKSKDDDLLVIKKFAKNYIPCLLNLYISDANKDKAMKTTVYQTMWMFFSINDQESTEKLYDSVLRKKDEEEDVKKKILYLDILRCIVCNLKNANKIIEAFEYGMNLSKNKNDKLEQKKAFRLIEELIKSSPVNYQLLNDYYLNKNESFYDNMINYYSANYSSVSVFAAQASFTRIIEFVINQQFKDKKLSIDEINKLIPIMINILQNRKSAKLSISVFSVLNNCIQLMDNGTNQIIQILVNNLNEKELNVDRRATLIFILHNVLLKYKDQIDSQTKSSLITTLLNNLTNENRKIVNVILLFLNDWFKLATKDEMLPYINNFINYLNSIDNPTSPIFKYKIKNLIEKMVKKFGEEIVIKMLDNKYQRLIRIMLKKERRDKRSDKKKSTNRNKNSIDELDDDEDVMDDDELRDFRKTKANKRWKFDEDDEFDGFHIFDAVDKDGDDEMKEEDNLNKEIKSNKKVTFNQVLRIDKEGQIMSDNDEENISKPLTKSNKNNSDSESDDDELNLKSNKKKQQNSNVRERILNKYKRKRGAHRDTNITASEFRSKRYGGDKKKQQKYNIKESIINKSKRKRGIHRDTNITGYKQKKN